MPWTNSTSPSVYSGTLRLLASSSVSVRLGSPGEPSWTTGGESGSSSSAVQPVKTTSAPTVAASVRWYGPIRILRYIRFRKLRYVAGYSRTRPRSVTSVALVRSWPRRTTVSSGQHRNDRRWNSGIEARSFHRRQTADLGGDRGNPPVRQRPSRGRLGPGRSPGRSSARVLPVVGSQQQHRTARQRPAGATVRRGAHGLHGNPVRQLRPGVHRQPRDRRQL